MPEEELVHVQTLIEEAGKFVLLLLPRSIKLEISGTEQKEAVISVLRGDFLRKILALIAMDVNELRIPTGTIIWAMSATRRACGSIIVPTCSSGSALREQAPAFWQI